MKAMMNGLFAAAVLAAGCKGDGGSSDAPKCKSRQTLMMASADRTSAER